MMLYILVFIFIAIVVFHISTRYNRYGRTINKIQGPFAYPIFGNMLAFNVKCPSEFWSIGRRYTKDFYPLLRFWLCTQAVVSIGHPDDVEILLTSQKVIEKGYVYDYIKPWLKTGLLTSTGEKWRQRRKILTPAFHFSILKKYVDITNETGQKFIRSLKAEGKQSVQNLISMCSKYTLDIICESAMGVSLDTMDQNIVEQYKKAIHNMGYLVIYRMPRPYIYSWMMPFIYKIGSMHRNALNVLFKFTDSVINERKEYHKKTNNKYLTEFLENTENNADIDSIGSKKRLAMLDLLLAAKENGLIDDEGIKEEVDTFTFEGHDTSGMCMVYTLLLIAEHTEIQNRVRSEVTELLDKTNGNLDIKDLQELSYLERCIKESLRLYPPVATLMRYTREDLQLKHAFVPANTQLLINLYDTHRDPNFWPEPDKFDPDRFLPELTKTRHPFAYVPFSAGPRNCIGQKFAMLELKSLIARIIYDFYLEPIDREADIKLIADIIIRPLKSPNIKLIKINK